MKRLFLIFHGRFPSEKAASLFAAKSAETFARQKLEVEVLVPRRRGVRSETAYEYFDVSKNFKITELESFSFFEGYIPRKIYFLISFIVFSFSCMCRMKKCSGPEDIVYSNESFPLYCVSFIRNNTFYEMHDFPESKLFLFGKLLKRMRWVLIHNRWKLEATKKLFPDVDPKRFLYEPNAVDVGSFDLDVSKEEARETLGLPLDRKIVVYTGHLYGWKGANILAASEKYLSGEFLIVFVGGTEKDVDDFKKRFGMSEKIMIVGHKPHKDIPLWQRAADMLVLPNTGKEKISAYYTSPMKLFEYMASRKPIIASDIPSVREIVDEKSATLVLPDDPQALALALSSVALKGDTTSDAAWQKVQNHTWNRRAERIISFMKN